MEYIRRLGLININKTFFIWCFSLPVFAFIITLQLSSGYIYDESAVPMSISRIKDFIRYYDTYLFREFFKIFLNNSVALLVMVYFTPLVLVLCKMWSNLRKKELRFTAFEKILLYLFPGLFLVKQAVNIALVLNNLSGNINMNVIITFAGIVLPHGLPEFLVFAIAGAISMEATKRLLFSTETGKPVNIKAISLLVLITAVCAFIEVYLTPKVFAVIMAATGLTG